ncbi:MAG: hypothetical protein ACOYLO_00400 [Ferruginibacter sp.]
MKANILAKLPIILNDKTFDCCGNQCPYLYADMDKKIIECYLFGELIKSGSYVLREEDCIKAEEAARHFVFVAAYVK